MMSQGRIKIWEARVVRLGFHLVQLGVHLINRRRLPWLHKVADDEKGSTNPRRWTLGFNQTSITVFLLVFLLVGDRNVDPFRLVQPSATPKFQSFKKEKNENPLDPDEVTCSTIQSSFEESFFSKPELEPWRNPKPCRDTTLKS